MPKRTNTFQKLILEVKRHLAAGAIVEESKLLIDQKTGAKVEVDVCIETSIAGNDVRFAIECTKLGRKATVEWVQRMLGKHESLPTDVVVLASSSGFSKNALKKAKASNIQTIILEDFSEKSGAGLIPRIESLWVKSFGVSATKVVAEVKPAIGDIPERITLSPDNSVFAPNGSLIGPAIEVVNAILSCPAFVVEFGRQATAEHKFLELVLSPPTLSDGRVLCLQRIEPLTIVPIDHLRIVGSCKVQLSEFPVKRSNIDKVEVTWGEGEFLGAKALVVSTKDPKGIRRISLSAKNMEFMPTEIKEGEPPPKMEARRNFLRGE